MDLLIGAFAKLTVKHPQSRLYIIGKIPKESEYYRDLLSMIQKYGIADNIIWVGFTKNPYNYEKYADCFVLPSRKEGLPNVVLDAMYLMTPVVVTRSVPVIDRIVTSERGYVIDVDDEIAFLEGMERAVRMKISKTFENNTNKQFLNLFEA